MAGAIRTTAAAILLTVMPTATAPITENVVWQPSEGMRCFTMPRVAWNPAIAAGATKAAATISFSHIGRTKVMRRWPAASVSAAAATPIRMAPGMPAPVLCAQAPAVAPTNAGRAETASVNAASRAGR